MQHAETIITGWLSGLDRVNGMDNPAGPLYIEGQRATEAALTDTRVQVCTRCSSCSASGGAQCC